MVQPAALPPGAVEDWDDFCFRYLSDRSGHGDALRRVIDADPDSAVPRAMAAVLGALGVPGFDPAAEAAAAETGRVGADWERSLVHAAVRHAREGAWAAYPDWLRHHREFPGDLLGWDLASNLSFHNARPDRLEQVRALCEATRRVVGDVPGLLGRLAMVAQDEGDLHAAHGLSERVLAVDPGSYRGAHPRAHVHFESGEHDSGLVWLDGWLAQRADRSSDWFEHLSWHAALHALGRGDGAETVRRYLAISRLGLGRRVVDLPSLLWRCQLHALVPPGTDPAETPAIEVVAPLRGVLPNLLVAYHVALGLAGAGDAEGLRALAADAGRAPAPGVAELVPPIAHGLAAYVEGEHAGAADLLLTVEPHLHRFGGSHAQREVLEDTLLESLLRAGRVEEATVRLRARLDRRESLLDRHRLARTLPTGVAG